MLVTIRIAFLIYLFCNLASAELTLKEIRTASDDILVAFFSSDTFDLDETDISDISKWRINGRDAEQVSRYVTSADKVDHYVYLKTGKLVEGKSYLIKTPYGDKQIQFNSQDILCESIKINQAAYSALSKARYAIFSIWLGTAGAVKINAPLPSFDVLQQYSGEKIHSGQLEFSADDESSGDMAYRIDLSALPAGGPYKIVVQGYGSSYPFAVGGEFSKRLAYTMFRAQYLQRCGVPIEKPQIREKACHTMIYDVDGPIGEANIVVKGDERTFKCYGGYHDAGDADRRAYHLVNPIINLMIYEAFPDLFYDGQYDIPGEFDQDYNIVSYTNNIPDIIDEAEWGTLAWEYLQNEDGSVHFGTETKGYPSPFAAPMDQDDKKYGTVKTDPRATCTSAGLFMHLARILKPYKPERSKELYARAQKAMHYGADDMADPEKLYYYIQEYLLTGDQQVHDKVRELYTIAGSYKEHIFETSGYSLNNDDFDNPAYIYSYLIEKDQPTDPQIVAYFKSAIKAAADSNIAQLQMHAYPVGSNFKQGPWGHNVKQPKYACAAMLYWSLSKEQKYIDAASVLMDYKLGLNPLGISYVTGLGSHQVHNVHDRESAYTARKGWGPKPGITVFGPGVITHWKPVANIPAFKEMARERVFSDHLPSISFTEFTIFEVMTHDAFYTVLAGGGKWNGSDPYIQDIK